jgi:hypothetical protein
MVEQTEFDWATEPKAVPEALKKLKPEQNVVSVICRDARRGSPLTHEATAQEHIAEIESLMSRQAMGRYTIAEIAKILAQENNLDEMKLLPRLQEAAKDKKLAVTDPDTGGTPTAPNAQILIFNQWVHPEAVNALLDLWGVDYQFDWPRPWHSSATESVLGNVQSSGTLVTTVLPKFTMPARPSEVPQWLRDLSPDAGVHFFNDVGGRSREVKPAEGRGVIEMIEEVMARQATDFFTLNEAAQVLADGRPNLKALGMKELMLQAWKDGKLTIRDPSHNGPVSNARSISPSTDLVSVNDINAWLTSDGMEYQFPQAAQPLIGSQSGNANQNPWLIADPKDPAAKYDWYISARYFARQLVKADSTLLTKKDVLASKVVTSLSSTGFKKRGGAKNFDPATVKKAFTRVNLS